MCHIYHKCRNIYTNSGRTIPQSTYSGSYDLEIERFTALDIVSKGFLKDDFELQTWSVNPLCPRLATSSGLESGLLRMLVDWHQDREREKEMFAEADGAN